MYVCVFVLAYYNEILRERRRTHTTVADLSVPNASGGGGGKHARTLFLTRHRVRALRPLNYIVYTYTFCCGFGGGGEGGGNFRLAVSYVVGGARDRTRKGIDLFANNLWFNQHSSGLLPQILQLTALILGQTANDLLCILVSI